MTTTYEIYNTTEKDKAFRLIEELDTTNRKRAAIRHHWKKIHAPDQIHKPSTVVPKRRNDQDRIHQLEQRITDLEAQLRMALEGLDKEVKSECFLCKKDPQGYDLPCGHEICHPCFRNHLGKDGDIICKMCKNTFHFNDELIEDDIV